jgi:hypothetical protein
MSELKRLSACALESESVWKISRAKRSRRMSESPIWSLYETLSSIW